eukprot:RCo008145
MADPLEVDYSLINLFQLLAQKDPTKAGADVPIPSTITYQHGALHAWYVYDRESRQIVKKEKKQCTKDDIVQAFASDPGGASCAATFLYRKCEFMMEDVGKEATSVEWLTPEGVRQFVNKRERRPDGLLQKFVPPKLGHAAMLQCVWTPYVTVVQQRKNVLDLADGRYTLDDRCVTHEDKPHLSIEVHCGKSVRKRCGELCVAMASHLLAHERRVLTRMVAYFKVDRNGQYLLLWATHVVTYRFTVGSGPAAAAPQSTLMGGEQSTPAGPKGLMGPRHSRQDADQGPQSNGGTPVIPYVSDPSATSMGPTARLSGVTPTAAGTAPPPTP